MISSIIVIILIIIIIAIIITILIPIINVVTVDEIEELKTFNAYPNPATEQLNVVLELTQQSDVLISLTDITGRTVYNTQKVMNGANRLVLPVDQYQAGIYTLAVQIKGQQIVKKIIVE